MPVIDFNPRLPALSNEYGTAEERISGTIENAEGGRCDTKYPRWKGRFENEKNG